MRCGYAHFGHGAVFGGLVHIGPVTGVGRQRSLRTGPSAPACRAGAPWPAPRMHPAGIVALNEGRLAMRPRRTALSPRRYVDGGSGYPGATSVRSRGGRRGIGGGPRHIADGREDTEVGVFTVPSWPPKCGGLTSRCRSVVAAAKAAAPVARSVPRGGLRFPFSRMGPPSSPALTYSRTSHGGRPLPRRRDGEGSDDASCGDAPSAWHAILVPGLRPGSPGPRAVLRPAVSAQAVLGRATQDPHRRADPDPLVGTAPQSPVCVMWLCPSCGLSRRGHPELCAKSP